MAKKTFMLIDPMSAHRFQQAQTAIYKAMANLVVEMWDHWDDNQGAGDFDPIAQLAAIAEGYEGNKPNCIAQLIYYQHDNPLDLTMSDVCELCRDYAKT